MADLATRSRTLRLIEAFDAPQVEGPLRLFDEQQLAFQFPDPVVMIVGTFGGNVGVWLSNTGESFNFFGDASYQFWFSVTRVGGYVALVGDGYGQVWRSCDSTFQRWQRVYQIPEGGGITDFEYNPNTGRAILCAGDLSGFSDAYLYYTDDNGDTFTRIDTTGLLNVRSVFYNPVTDTWFAVGRQALGTPAIRAYRSFDDGLTWEVVPGLAAIGSNISLLDVAANPKTGAVCFFPNGGDLYRSLDNGETVDVANVGGRIFNGSVSPTIGEKGRWVIENEGTGAVAPTGWVAYSDDDGLTWTGLAKPAFVPGGSDIGDIRWVDNVETPAFLVAGRPSHIYRSENGLDYTLIRDDAGTGLITQLTPTAPPRAYRLTLPVERYEQIQEWRMNNAEDPVLVEQVSKDDRYRDKGLVNADLGLSDLSKKDTPPAFIPQTQERPDEGDDPLVYPDRQYPRSRSCRIAGGYVEIHGDIGRASKWVKYPNELVGETCEDLIP